MKKPKDWKWDNDSGVGFLPLTGREIKYDQAYFDNYARLAATKQGRVIVNLRSALVNRWAERGTILDVGIGCGQFIEVMRSEGWDIYGTDVNPVAIQWLNEMGYMWANDDEKLDVLTFWDVMEHIPDPGAIIYRHMPEWVFVSMPIYIDEKHALSSKHFKPGEHCWYFTENGLRSYMVQRGYVALEINALESVEGKREDVWSFAFWNANSSKGL